MFFFIGGIQPRKVLLEESMQICHACGRPAVRTLRIDHYLSLFFIPLFPVKKGTPFQECGHCHNSRKPADAELARCPFCQRTVAPDFTFCPYCSHRL